jgi:hypothetical protein
VCCINNIIADDSIESNGTLSTEQKTPSRLFEDRALRTGRWYNNASVHRGSDVDDGSSFWFGTQIVDAKATRELVSSGPGRA